MEFKGTSVLFVFIFGFKEKMIIRILQNKSGGTEYEIRTAAD